MSKEGTDWFIQTLRQARGLHEGGRMAMLIESYGGSRSKREVQISREGRHRYLVEMITRGTIKVTYRRAYTDTLKAARQKARAFRAEWASTADARPGRRSSSPGGS